MNFAVWGGVAAGGAEGDAVHSFPISDFKFRILDLRTWNGLCSYRKKQIKN